MKTKLFGLLLMFLGGEGGPVRHRATASIGVLSLIAGFVYGCSGAEVKTPVVTYQVRMMCDVTNCTGEMKYGDPLVGGAVVLLSNPPQYPHRCNKCGATRNFFEAYPVIRYEEAPKLSPAPLMPRPGGIPHSIPPGLIWSNGWYYIEPNIYFQLDGAVTNQVKGAKQ